MNALQKNGDPDDPLQANRKIWELNVVINGIFATYYQDFGSFWRRSSDASGGVFEKKLYSVIKYLLTHQ